MINTLFAAETESGGILGFNLQAFAIQMITFVLVFFLLKKFAFNPIVRMLEKRRKTIEDGVKLGEQMEKRQAKMDEEAQDIIRAARNDADRIIENANKESREIQQEAEKAAKQKADAMIADAQERIEEDVDQAKRKLEKDVVGLVSEATETIVGEKVDAKKDAKLVDKALKKESK